MNNVASQLAFTLTRNQKRIVFAESCTAGLVAATLAQVPGISNWLCGSAVTYRPLTKQSWLGVQQRTLDVHTPESREVAEEMAREVLAKTAEADLAAAVTGHLGPSAPKDMDGVIFVAIAYRKDDQIKIAVSEQVRLDRQERVARQQEAAEHVLSACCQFVENPQLPETL